ncbi:MAG: CBS domain-containing protein [Actinomycetota bacterium]
MPLYQPPLSSSALEPAIDRHPIMVTAETSLAEVIALMSQVHSSCLLPSRHLSAESKRSEEPSLNQARASCVLVIQKSSISGENGASRYPQSALLGLFTEWDVVRLIATGIIDPSNQASLDSIPVAEVMSPSAITFTESDDSDVFTALSLFRQHRIRYLAVISENDTLVGVLMRERIRQLLQPSNILKMRRVSELMTEPLAAPKNASLLAIAQLMTEHQVSCAVITQLRELQVENRHSHSTPFHYSFQQPVGMITEQDLVLAQFLGLDFLTTPAHKIMRTPLQFLTPNDSLWVAHKQMQQNQAQRLVVCGVQGEMVGIVTQTSLLRALDPTEMYRAVKKLQQSVYQLQVEKLELLQSRNAKLEEEVRERTTKLHEQVQHDRLLAKIALRIHQFLKLEEILNATVAEVRQLLKADRVAIVRVEPNNLGIVVAESVGANWPPTLGWIMSAESLQECNQMFEQQIYTFPHEPSPDLSPEQLSGLKQAQIQAYMVVPIRQDSNIWGIVCVHQCSRVRQWQQSEVDLLLQLATQVAIAIQQAQLYQQVQNLNTDLEYQVQERTAQLQQKVQELQRLNVLKDEFLSTVSHELRTPLTNMKIAIHMLKVAPTPERSERYLEILETECNRETELINALLDLQRLEAGAYPITLEPVNLPVWLPTIIEPFRSRIQNCQQVLRVESALDLPTITSNRANLGRVLAELLNNACKYTPTGGEIHLKVECKNGVGTAGKAWKKSRSNTIIIPPETLQEGEGETSLIPSISSSDSASSIQVCVSNQAEIPTEELPRIFDKFYRVPNADPWKQGGTGLGLALVQKLVEQLGGKIQVVSGGGWTTFTVELPV